MAKSKRTAGPNRFPEPRGTDPAATLATATAAAAAAAALQGAGCRFLGQDFVEGDTICYRDEVWICSLGQWTRTGVAC